MPNWDDPRGPRHDTERDRWRREGQARGRDDRTRRDDRGDRDWGRRDWNDGERRSFDRPDEPWRRDRESASPDAAYDPEYLRWRDEQMRAHDRDYEDWRREQHRKYDEDYRRFRDERQRHFGQAFHDWRSQRSAVGGVPDTSIGSVGQGQGGYGDKTGAPGGYNAESAVEKPGGYLDPPGHLSTDPAMRQAGGVGGQPGEAQGGDRAPEFGREPPQVKSAADGQPQKNEARDEASRRR